MNPKTCIITASGSIVDLSADKYYVSIEDIAHSLAYKPRFNGHMDMVCMGPTNWKNFYSVALHCLRVSELVPPQLALQGLMHDAHEALVGDVPTPMKRVMESNADDAGACCKFNTWEFSESYVSYVLLQESLGMKAISPEEEREVAQADRQALIEEVSTCFSPAAQKAWIKLGYDIDPTFKYREIPSPEVAKRQFVARYHDLTSPVVGRSGEMWERHGRGMVPGEHPTGVRRNDQ